MAILRARGEPLNPLARFPYLIAAGAASIVARWTPPGGGKTQRSFAARRNAVGRLVAWGHAHRMANRPFLWMHAASVGEGLMARPIIARLRETRPDLQIAYTFFSPSAEALAARLGVDVADYLPFDSLTHAHALLSALRPDLLVFSKLDVWPVLAEEAAARGVPVALVSAALAPNSRRLSWMARAVLGDAYAALAAVGAADDDTAGRLASLGVHRDRITVTGDTRYDQVWARVREGANANIVGRLRTARPTLVAGSTWPADEAVLVAAWDRVVAARPDARLVIAAHEPADAWRDAMVHHAMLKGRSAATLDTATPDTDIVIVDRMGVLADLYAAGNVAYVGGGFHAAGLHSVVEPAAHGLPVVTGPRHGASRDARSLIAAGGAFAADSAASLHDTVIRLLTDHATATTAGARAREVVERELGATERTVALLAKLLDRPRG